MVMVKFILVINDVYHAASPSRLLGQFFVSGSFLANSLEPQAKLGAASRWPHTSS